MTAEQKLLELKERLAEVNDLDMVNALLNWDQSTYMPAGGAPARARQSATLAKISLEKLTDPAVGKLLDDLLPYAESLPPDSDDAALIQVARRDYERLIRVPAAFIAEFFEHSARSYQQWTTARPANDFAVMRPMLEKMLDLSRRMADFFPGYEHIADPLIEYADYGMKVSTLRPLFAELRAGLAPLAQAITAQPPADDACLRGHFPEAPQLEFGLQIIRDIGYDFERGRQDKTHHPFMTKFSLGDVRITTRVREDFLGEALFSTIHECGHAVYEQGIHPAYEATPLAAGTSAGVHESQSRLWENVVGRSKEFWQHYYPRLQAVFPQQLERTPLETFHKAINKVENSLIRTDADEVTYNLHVMLRFDFELALLEGSLAVKDLPDAWRARFAEDFGVTPPDDRDGVLQDAHWYAGQVGGVFQGYTLGNVLGLQFYAQALAAHPTIPAEISRGQFATLHNWLRENVYRPGRKYTASELVQRVTGGSMSIEPYLSYLRQKYSELYALNLAA